MSKDFPGISRETYIKSDAPTGRSLTYDMLSDIRGHQLEIKTGCVSMQKSCGEKFEKIEKRKRFDTGLSGVSGIVGGFLAVVTQAIVRKITF